MIVLVGSEKGGVGKSTIAAHVAVRLSMTGKPTILIDADPQATSWAWAQARNKYKPDSLRVETTKMTGDIRPGIKDLAASYGHIVVDCGGADSVALRSGMMIAHRLIIPSKVARRDLETLKHVSTLVHTANEKRESEGQSQLLARVVFNMTRALPNFWTRIEGAKKVVESLGLGVCPYPIVERVSYDDTQYQGGTVFDDKTDQKAIDEMERVLKSLLRKENTE
ncbi:plasmid segregation oscillating ATPase ParF [Marinobacter antarcticus]|jgi:chromosome partitioning protein|uniref:Plasmid segregation oscillating ATPase ParF n=1 Tax=Marinobacter antarcticus TaxID=564117 RepID=A0A1M6W9H3_9GAMM|nr:AAA family ATPase [Marinobacter antarcticus]SHK90145.1 plasmid segregation oscillating ATPase ParF [Marinobacter antarcticus]